jgi:hypothetical protein
MANFLTSILGAFTNNNNTTKAKTTTDTSDQLTSKQLANYNTQAKDLVREYDTNRDGYLSAKEAKEMPLFEGQDLSTTMFDKLFTSLAQRGMSQVELSRTLQLMDADKDGEVKSKERNSFVEDFTAELKNGANPNELYATLSANALRHGGAKSTRDELSNLKALFEKYGIDNYTPDKETTEEGATGFEKYVPLIEAGLPLLQGLMGKTATSDTADTNRDQELAQPPLSSSLGSLPQLSPLGSPSFASQLPPPQLSLLGSLPPLPQSQEILLGLGSNPLPLAAGNNAPLMPAQTAFAPPLGQGQLPFTFAQAQPDPTVATVPPSTAWTPPAPAAQAQVPASGWNPLPTTTIAQAPVNGGW